MITQSAIDFFQALVKNFIESSYKEAFIMENRDELFEKIQTKEKEWEKQIEFLQKRAQNFDSEVREKVEGRIEILRTKLGEIKERTCRLKNASDKVEDDVAQKIIYSWVEMFTKIDNAMIKLKD